MTFNSGSKVISISSHGDHDYGVVRVQSVSGLIVYLTEHEFGFVWTTLYHRFGFENLRNNVYRGRQHYKILYQKLNPDEPECEHKDYELIDTGDRIVKCKKCDWVMSEGIA